LGAHLTGPLFLRKINEVMKHVVSIDDINEDEMKDIFHRAKQFSLQNLSSYDFKKPNIRGQILANVFYEPSTRTSSSFNSAMLRLGGSVISIDEINYSSVAKGENLQDTIQTMSCYCDVIVLRTKEEGQSKLAAEVSKVPIINAGDGKGEHPTQTLLDLYTILQYHKSLNINIVFAGDIKNGRTVHSLAKALEGKAHLAFCEHYDSTLIDNLATADVLYMTRLQKERGTKGSYSLTKEMVSQLNKNAIVMHPFPRNEEIPRWFDSDKRAVYFEQMQNGLYVRN